MLWFICGELVIGGNCKKIIVLLKIKDLLSYFIFVKFFGKIIGIKY